eukprot:CAMPEP_0119349322 /NCGR_PEP_ID=MMETSP1333-20130426/109492_1 /TAXON_ID=418940 /ORGANISM="Scyphosphaera apsteinii, Strain RCC1455" /LENGTH=203 /DNA_ID=CAMNT_0007361917 /DNA_START=124 /DNA_END=736 /DNA_ORIENTATION=-
MTWSQHHQQPMLRAIVAILHGHLCLRCYITGGNEATTPTCFRLDKSRRTCAKQVVELISEGGENGKQWAEATSCTREAAAEASTFSICAACSTLATSVLQASASRHRAASSSSVHSAHGARHCDSIGDDSNVTSAEADPPVMTESAQDDEVHRCANTSSARNGSIGAMEVTSKSSVSYSTAWAARRSGSFGAQQYSLSLIVVK